MSRVLLVVLCLGLAGARPVRKTLNFNMFFLKPQDASAPERTVASADGVSRFGPIMEYLVQRVQNMMSVRLPPAPEPAGSAVAGPGEQRLPGVPDARPADNAVDAGLGEARVPGVVVRPSRTRPGTYEVQMDVLVDEPAR